MEVSLISFSIGTWSVVGMVAMPALFFAGAKFRAVAAYMDGKEPPPRRPVTPWVIFGLVFGFAIGSVYQGTSEDVAACKSAGNTLGACLIIPEVSRAGNTSAR